MQRDTNQIRRIKDMAYLSLDLAEPINNESFWLVSSFTHYKIWRRAIAMMKRRGWHIELCPSWVNTCTRGGREKRRVSPCHLYGKKELLEVNMEIFPIGCRFEFYQNVNFENKSGGRYDFHKYRRMPYLIKKAFEVETNHLIRLFQTSFGCTFLEQEKPKDAREQILEDCRSRSFNRNKIERLQDIPEKHAAAYIYSYNNQDRDKKTLECGQVKYFRDYSGRLCRGEIWHNINNMWWVITDRFTIRNVACFYLFDPTPEDFAQRRVMPDRMPNDVKARLDLLRSLSEAALRSQLRRKKNQLAA